MKMRLNRRRATLAAGEWLSLSHRHLLPSNWSWKRLHAALL